MVPYDHNYCTLYNLSSVVYDIVVKVQKTWPLWTVWPVCKMYPWWFLRSQLLHTAQLKQRCLWHCCESPENVATVNSMTCLWNVSFVVPTITNIARCTTSAAFSVTLLWRSRERSHCVQHDLSMKCVLRRSYDGPCHVLYTLSSVVCDIVVKVKRTKPLSVNSMISLWNVFFVVPKMTHIGHCTI